MKKIAKYTFGIGDRFGQEGEAQLQAFIEAKKMGIEVVPVWNKSQREHGIVGTHPKDVRTEADAAVKALGWKGDYYVDADHIRLETVDRYAEACDFFTLDVADDLAQTATPEEAKAYLLGHPFGVGSYVLAGETFMVDEAVRLGLAQRYSKAVQKAAAIYQHIIHLRGNDNFVTEVSMDEVDQPQSPLDLLFILASLAKEKVPAQTIAPRFPGRFNKGVNYVGSVEEFETCFSKCLAALAEAVTRYGLPATLKLSVHSGSDKFSIYKPMARQMKKYGAGIHIKTAGTTWLEECIGLAASGGEGLDMVKAMYAKALDRFDALCAPYASVIDVKKDRLPKLALAQSWDATTWCNSLRHDLSQPQYNPDLRQLMHVSFKLAAELGPQYLSALNKAKKSVSQAVTTNLLDRHILRFFGE
jgi:tagaturonate epimerase